MFLERYDRIRAHIAAEGFTPATQTRIALYLGAVKAAGLPFLVGATALPAETLQWQAMNEQFFRESEALALLARVTNWEFDPWIYAQIAAVVTPLQAETLRASMAGDPTGLDSLALGHARLATVRLAPIVPQELMLEPFAMALLRIEQENGRLLQTQIRLLKDGLERIPRERREEAVAVATRLTREVHRHFLDTLA
ncbi:hypothetical protein ACUSIJ_06105 [Pseudochelatococcus sp. B33]